MTPSQQPHPQRCETCETWRNRFSGTWPDCPMHIRPASVLKKDHRDFIVHCGCASHSSRPIPAALSLLAECLVKELKDHWLVFDNPADVENVTKEFIRILGEHNTAVAAQARSAEAIRWQTALNTLIATESKRKDKESVDMVCSYRVAQIIDSLRQPVENTESTGDEKR